MRTQVFCSVGLLRATIAPPKFKNQPFSVGFFSPVPASSGAGYGFCANVRGSPETRNWAVFPLSALSVLCFCECHIRTPPRNHAGFRPRV